MDYVYEQKSIGYKVPARIKTLINYQLVFKIKNVFISYWLSNLVEQRHLLQSIPLCIWVKTMG